MKRKLDYYLGNEIVHSVEFEIGHNSQLLCNVNNYCHGYGFSDYDFVSVDEGKLLVFPGKKDTYVSFYSNWLDENSCERIKSLYGMLMEPINSCPFQEPGFLKSINKRLKH